MDKDGVSIPDEEWERFLRDAGVAAPDAPKEPSARARAVTRRLREQPAQPVGWRTHQPVRRRRGKGWYVAGLLVAAVLLVVALAPGRVAGWFGGGGGDNRPLAAESVRPDEPPPTEAAVRRPTLDQPFRGSPAARWGDGTAGIYMPPARATGWMSEEQVARTLDRSLDFLVASSLDPGVLRGERPKRAIAMINPRQRGMKDYLATAFSAPSRENDPLTLFSRFDRTDVRLVGDVVKTRGRLTYREGERGAVEVTADVTYVYPVVRAAEKSDEVARTIVRRETVMSWDDPAKVNIEPNTFSLLSDRVDSTNGGCFDHTGYFRPEFGTARADSGSGEGHAVDPYERTTTMDERMKGASEDKCGKATRS
ncbi:hypothetical protein [Streptomyces sp. NPDC007088]|uniref:hypothetical protein n=1 Tax=Streptomyces sp. NPDC007088 TaxID=3364773 RepID=UPI0036CCDC59